MGLEVSKRSLMISQKALDIVNNNMSNVNTEGYTRQRLDTSSLYLASYRNWQTHESRLSLKGQGAYAIGVSQVRNEYLDKRFRDALSYDKEYEIKDSLLAELDTTLDQIESYGLKAAFEGFQADLRDYATNAADNVEISSIIRNDAEKICTIFQRYAGDLQALLTENIEDVEVEVTDINNTLDQIAVLNKQILDQYKASEFGNIARGVAVSQYGPLELMDQRNLLIDKLAEHGNIRVSENGDGTVAVEFGGYTLIDGVKPVEHLLLQDYDDYGASVVKLTNGEQLRLSTGELKGRLDMVNGNGNYATYYQSSENGIPYYISSVNAFAEAFAGLMNKVNGVVSTIDIDENDPNYIKYFPTEQRAMFGSRDDVYDSEGNLVKRVPITAANLVVSKEWQLQSVMPGLVWDDVNGAYAYAPNLDGLNLNKLQLALEDPIVIGRARDFTGSIFEFQSYLNNKLGQHREFNSQLLKNSDIITTELWNNRDAVSAVSDTEEGINMMVYQKWFNASSRMMTTLDEALDKLINGTGRVGL
jgi:flagellar hook-associated protein 1 FlgK